MQAYGRYERKIYRDQSISKENKYGREELVRRAAAYWFSVFHLREMKIMNPAPPSSAGPWSIALDVFLL